MREPLLMLYTLNHDGHSASFVRYLVEAWDADPAAGELAVVLSPRGAAKQPATNRARVVTIDASELESVKCAERRRARDTVLEALTGRLSAGSPAVRHWEVMRRYADALGATHVLVVNLESCFAAVVAQLDLPCPFSVILAAPLQLPGHDEPGTTRALARRIQERFVLERALAHAQLETFFYVDPRPFERLVRGAEKLVRLPTPVRRRPVDAAALERLRDSLGIEPGRRVCLLFGDLGPHKGILELVEAVSRLPVSVCRELCLALVGRLHGRHRGAVDAAIAALRLARPVQVVTQFEWLPEDDVGPLFELADVVALPYRRDVGPSNVLALAAAAGRPVVAPERGLVGSTVRDYGLGLTVDPARPDEMASALERLLRRPDELVDREGMRRLAAESAVETFSRRILARIRPGVPA